MLTSTAGTGGAVAYCPMHPDTQAITTCDRCGNYMCMSCLGSGGTCGACREREAERWQGQIEKTAGRLVFGLRAFSLLAALESVAFALATFGLVETPGEDDFHVTHLLALLALFPLFTSMYLFAAWMRRTQLGTAPIARHPLAYGPNAWGWFFCPVLNLWKPYQAVHELYLARSGELQGPQVFGLWWGSWILWNFFSRVSESFGKGGVVPELEAISYALGTAAALFAVQVVKHVTAARPQAR